MKHVILIALLTCTADNLQKSEFDFIFWAKIWITCRLHSSLCRFMFSLKVQWKIQGKDLHIRWQKWARVTQFVVYSFYSTYFKFISTFLFLFFELVISSFCCVYYSIGHFCNWTANKLNACIKVTEAEILFSLMWGNALWLQTNSIYSDGEVK